MRIHKEGYKVISVSVVVSIVLAAASIYFLPLFAGIPLAVIFVSKALFMIWFFRYPKRTKLPEDNLTVYAPADGTIVAVEEVFVDEYLEENMIQVSVFMSLCNVHVNWYPVGGRIEYFKKHEGRFMVAWNPKSSTDNERTTTVVNTGTHRILFRQIAGFLARRIVSYSAGCEGGNVEQNSQCGFIKLGSRVDVLLPLGSTVLVNMGDKVTGSLTALAELPSIRNGS